MRILSVTAQKPDSTGSGVYLTELVKEFNKMGHEQAVLAGIYESDEILLPEGVEFYPVYFRTRELPFPITGMSDEMPYESTKYSDMTDEMTEQFVNAFRKQIKKVLREFNPEVILCHHLYFLTAMVREICPNTKVYGFCHGSDLRQIKKNPWERDYIKEQIGKLDKIFALHEEQKMQICEFHELAENQVEAIGTGYNSDLFFISDELKALKDVEKNRYIFAGKISEKKGVMSFMKALHYLETPEKAEVVLAGGYGNEEEYAEIIKMAEEAPCKVEFLGKLTHEELAREMNLSDVFVLPSFFEGLPLVNIEAMACGLKVVCTDLPGIQGWMEENIPDNSVVFVQPPLMENEDEPIKESLPKFEKNLAKAMEEAMRRPSVDKEKIESVSWKGLAKRVICEIYK